MSDSPSNHDHDFWMQQALELARHAAEMGEVPVGALVVRGHEIIGKGWNQSITRDDPTAHAEVLAVRDAARNVNNYRLPEATLYVTVEPCMMCLGAIIHARVARICYGAPEPKAGALISRPISQRAHFNHFPHVSGGVLAEPCSEVMSAFFANRRRQQQREKLAPNDKVV
ncbi:MAG: tRNA adenosine(34) deaminase TadA [Gammaproteobacteria bacterium]|nr:tRNA adenosine(34) deaminase TadA [Gammaproteobacteria bacterium]